MQSSFLPIEMAEGIVEVLATDPKSFREQNFSACDVIIHAQDLVSYIAKQNRINFQVDCYLFVHAQVKEIIEKIVACQIRPLFVVDGTLDVRENISLTLPRSRIICEFLAMCGVSYAVTRSNAVSTCLALSCMLGIPILGSNCKFYLCSFPSSIGVNIFSRPLSEPIFVPLECLQNLNSKSTHLRAKVYDASGCLRIKRIPTNHRPVLSLIMELVSLPPNSNKNLELDFVAKWLSAAGPLAILQRIMQSAVSYVDPSLILQSVTEYLISFTPDFEEAIRLLPYLGLNGDNFPSPDVDDVEPDSPQFFLNLAMNIIEGRPSRHFRIGISGSTLLDLFHRGKIDASTLSTSDSKSYPSIYVLRWLQRSALSNSISVSDSWSYLAEFFHFSITVPLNENFSAIMLCCLLWHSKCPRFCAAIELCPIILSSVFCALISILCEHASVVFFAMLEYFEVGNSSESSLEETYYHQAQEILQIYSEILSFCNIFDGSRTSKISLLKKAVFDPIFVVFPCLRLSALIAIKLHSCDPEKRLFKLINSPFMDALKADTPGLLLVFRQFMNIIKTTKIYWNYAQLSPAKVVKTPPVETKISDSIASAKTLQIDKNKSLNSLGGLYNPRSDTSISISRSHYREKLRVGEQQFPGSEVFISNSPGRSIGWRRKNNVTVGKGGKDIVGQPDYDRPKTPPPANAFMKKSKKSSAYAARLAQRYGNKL